MNKKILLIGCVVAALGTGFGIAQRETDTPMKSLMMENVEALATDELEGNVVCIGVGCVDCSRYNVKVEVVYSGRSLLVDE